MKYDPTALPFWERNPPGIITKLTTARQELEDHFIALRTIERLEARLELLRESTIGKPPNKVETAQEREERTQRVVVHLNQISDVKRQIRECKKQLIPGLTRQY